VDKGCRSNRKHRCAEVFDNRSTVVATCSRPQTPPDLRCAANAFISQARLWLTRSPHRIFDPPIAQTVIRDQARPSGDGRTCSAVTCL
jgi:hypothetical protein